MRRPQVVSGGLTTPGRWATIREPVLDTTLALLLWAGMVVDLATKPLNEGQSPTSPAAYAWTAVIAAPVAVHRRLPIVAMLISNLALVTYALGHYSAYPGYPTFVLVFAVALHAGRRRALVVYLGGVVALSVALLLQSAVVATASSWISTLLTLTVAWLAGENLRSRRARRRAELDNARRQAEHEAEQARRAVSAERLRIARDLHDVVAHSLSVIAVQAGVAHHVIDDQPTVARDALGNIEVTARDGLVEMRRLLGLLRFESGATGDPGTTSVDGLRDADRLLSQFRSAGLPVDASDLRAVGDLPPALDITAYRIIQEGLTNVLRHGGPVAHLSVERSPKALRIGIHDDGRTTVTAPATPDAAHDADGSASTSGHGLTGIRERVALFGGVMRADPEPGGGFGLVVELPLEPPVAQR
ncbi:MAG: sensor histidine kinase [Dermatophilaceae bacterium]